MTTFYKITLLSYHSEPSLTLCFIEQYILQVTHYGYGGCSLFLFEVKL